MIAVRKATCSDVLVVVAYIQKKAEFDRDLGYFNGQLGTTAELIKKALFGDPVFAYAILAAKDSKEVGFAFYHYRFSSFQARPIMWLDDFYVDIETRRSGAGLEIMGALQVEAAKHECTNIAWTTGSKNISGVAFYEKLGATLVSQNGEKLAYSIKPEFLLERIQKIKEPKHSV